MRACGFSSTASMLVWLIVGLQVATTLAQESSQTTTAPSNKPHKLFCILLDGFRWDYFDRASDELPGFSRLLKEGVRAAWLNPPFPSISYPSWTSIVTGQYPETHGIVNNYIYDSVEKELFGLEQDETSAKEKWWTSEPLWTTATLADLEVALVRWARCDVGIKGTYPEFCTPYDGNETFRERLDLGLQKFGEGFDVAMVYYSKVDDIGHKNGPDSAEVKDEVAQVDSEIAYLQKKLEEMLLENETNIVILSDHGMTMAISENVTVLEIDNFLNVSLVDNICGSETFFNIKVPEENVDKVYEQLQEMKGVDVFRRENIPENLHIKNSKYTNEIVVIAKPGVVVLGSKDTTKQLTPRHDEVVGVHGYYPDMKDMKGIFFAKGPDFAKGKETPEIDVVDVYQVLISILRLQPQPHNGTWDHVTGLFLERPLEESESEGSSAFLAIILILTAGVLLIGLAWRFQLKERCMAAKDSYSRSI